MTEGEVVKNEPGARVLWTIVVEEAGASEGDWDQWRYYFDSGERPLEFRFMGLLGFGGKLWVRRTGPAFVNCYPEDETPERREIIERTNARLAALYDAKATFGE